MSDTDAELGGSGLRFCSKCRAIYRAAYSRCPIDGTELELCEQDPLIGCTIGGVYVVDECVGEGAMGRVYRTHHHRLPRKKFALKVLLGELAAEVAMRLRFAQEAEAASRLSHPNVVSVLDFDKSPDGLLYLVMEFVEGRSLSVIIEREGPLPAARVVRLARQLCLGLAHAHDEGLVHRDFKPDNVIVVDHGPDTAETPRIADFGLAIFADPNEGSARLTRAGLVVGTPIYTAPEQATDAEVDHRADLFALGVAMYEMLAGAVPFDGTTMEMLYKNATQEPPLIGERRPGVEVPPALEAIVRRLMARDPNARFRSAREVTAALDEVPLAASASTAMWAQDTQMSPSLQLPAQPDPAAQVVGAAATQVAPLAAGELGAAATQVAPLVAAGPAAAATQVVPVAESDPGGLAPLAVEGRARRWPWLAAAGAVAVLAGVVGVVLGGVGAAPTSGRNARVGGPAAERALGARAAGVRGADQVAVADAALGATAGAVLGAGDGGVAGEPPGDGIAGGAPADAGVESDEPSEAESAREAVSRTRRRAPRTADRGRAGRRAGARKPDASSDDSAPAVPERPPPSSADPAAAVEGPTPTAPPRDAAPAPTAAAPTPPVASPTPPVASPEPTPAPDPTPAPRPVFDGTMRFTKLRVGGSLTRSDVEPAIARVSKKWRACYRSAARRAGGAKAGSVQVRFSIDESRRARGIKVRGGPLPGLSDCIAKSLGSLTTRKAPDITDAPVSFTIGFSPAEAAP